MLVGVDILESLWAGGMGFSPSLMRHGNLVLREHADDAVDLHLWREESRWMTRPARRRHLPLR